MAVRSTHVPTVGAAIRSRDKRSRAHVNCEQQTVRPLSATACPSAISLEIAGGIERNDADATDLHLGVSRNSLNSPRAYRPNTIGRSGLRGIPPPNVRCPLLSTVHNVLKSSLSTRCRSIIPLLPSTPLGPSCICLHNSARASPHPQDPHTAPHLTRLEGTRLEADNTRQSTSRISSPSLDIKITTITARAPALSIAHTRRQTK